MLNVFKKDVVSEINNQYQDLYQLVKNKLNFDREKCTSEYFLIWWYICSLKKTIKWNHEGGQGKNLKEFEIYDTTNFKKCDFFENLSKGGKGTKNFHFW